MSVPPEKIPPLPQVPSPLGWSWYYFRIRYLSIAASGLTLVMVVWLWSINLPEATGVSSDARFSESVDPVPNMEQPTVVLVSTNLPDLHTTATNGNLDLGGGL